MEQKLFASKTDSSSEVMNNNTNASYHGNTFFPTLEKFKPLIIMNNSSPSHPIQSVCSTAEHCEAKHVTAYGCVVKLQMCREIIVPVKLPGRVFPVKPSSALRAPPCAPHARQGLHCPRYQWRMGTGCAGHGSGTSRSSWEAWTHQD